MTSENPLNGQFARGRGGGVETKSKVASARKSEALSRQIKSGGFKIKSYYARSVEEALGKAREEMGSDTILVHSRKTPLESRHLGPYEVVFAQPGPGQRPEQDGLQEAAADGSGRPPIATAYGPGMRASRRDRAAHSGGDGEERLAAELKQMRRQMDAIMHAMSLRQSPELAPTEQGGATTDARRQLLDAGLDDDIATEITEAASLALQGGAPAKGDAAKSPNSTIRGALKAELAARLHLAPPTRERGATASIVAFIGPPGAGKTSSLAKLAFRVCEMGTRPIHLISADSYRIGASEQLRTFASILGASIDFADSPKQVAQAIEANQHKETILIDTPGLSGSDFELLDDLAAYLGGHSGIEKHLVLPATMRSKDLKRCLQQYEGFNADRLLFTRLDETDCFGPLYCTAVRSATPLSFLSAGQQIPEDLEEATEKKVLELLLGVDGSQESAGAEGSVA